MSWKLTITDKEGKEKVINSSNAGDYILQKVDSATSWLAKNIIPVSIAVGTLGYTLNAITRSKNRKLVKQLNKKQQRDIQRMNNMQPMMMPNGMTVYMVDSQKLRRL